MNLIYFSPTGNTKKVVELIASNWNKENKIYDITQDIQDCEIDHELSIIGVPSHAGRVPKAAMERIKQLHATQTPVILVVTYGNRAYEDTLLELKNLATAANFHVIGAICAVCEHSIMHKFAAGRPTSQDCDELLSFAKQIQMQTIQCNAQVHVDGKLPYRDYGGIPLFPKTNKKCTNCGLCEYECPTHAIYEDHGIHLDKQRCISCMRCINICPQHARSVPYLLVKGATKLLEKECREQKHNSLFLLHNEG